MRRIRPKLTYANVMATIAVFAVLGGGAYAASKIGPKDIKKNAVRAKHIKNKAVKAPKIAKNAVRPKHVTSMHAVVDVNGNLARGENVASTSLSGNGSTEVIFKRRVRNCTYVATPGQVEPGVDPTAMIGVAPLVDNPRGVLVSTRTHENQLEHRNIHVLVAC